MVNKFEPNHQSMLISRDLALLKFDEDCKIISDGIWKREIINNSDSFFYINEPVINFYLDGISNKKPTIDVNFSIQEQKNLNFQKILILIKLLIPKNLYILYPYFQNIKVQLLIIFSNLLLSIYSIRFT